MTAYPLISMKMSTHCTLANRAKKKTCPGHLIDFVPLQLDIKPQGNYTIKVYIKWKTSKNFARKKLD